MEFIEIIILLLFCGLSFLLGQRFSKDPPAAQPIKLGKYKSLKNQDEDDEENDFPLIENEKLQKNLKGHQKENDRLMQEIQELKAVQRKNLMEIDYLKAQLAKNLNTKKPSEINENSNEVVHDELINDIELKNILQDNIQPNQDISNIDKEMEDALLNN